MRIMTTISQILMWVGFFAILVSIPGEIFFGIPFTHFIMGGVPMWLAGFAIHEWQEVKKAKEMSKIIRRITWTDEKGGGCIDIPQKKPWWGDGR